MMLFGLMLALAAMHRYRAAPALQEVLFSENARPELILRALRTTMICETVVAALILATVALLGSLEPPVAAYLRPHQSPNTLEIVSRAVVGSRGCS